MAQGTKNRRRAPNGADGGADDGARVLESKPAARAQNSGTRVWLRVWMRGCTPHTSPLLVRAQAHTTHSCVHTRPHTSTHTQFMIGQVETATDQVEVTTQTTTWTNTTKGRSNPPERDPADRGALTFAARTTGMGIEIEYVSRRRV